MNDFVREAKRREDALADDEEVRGRRSDGRSSARAASRSAKASRPTKIDDADRRDSPREIAELDADVAAAKAYRLALEAIVKEIQAAGSSICEKQIAAIETELKRLRRKPRPDITAASGEWINRWPGARRALHRQHQARPDLVAGYEDQLQLQLRRPLRPLHHLPSGDRQDGARLGDGAGLPGDSARRARAHRRAADAAKRRPQPPRPKTARKSAPTLASVYGIMLADRPQVDPDGQGRDGSGRRSRKASPPRPACEMGDVIQEINGGSVYDPRRRRALLAGARRMGQAADAQDSPRPRSAVHVAPAARPVRRRDQPAQEGRDGLHDLPRRAGQRDRFQVGLAHAERLRSRPSTGRATTAGSTTITGSSR